MKKRKPPKYSMLLLVIGGLLLIFAANQIRILERASQATLTQVSVGHNEETYPEIERITPADALAALEAGTAVVVDVRIADAYGVGHIPGALSIPLGEIETRLGELDPDQWIITYCT